MHALAFRILSDWTDPWNNSRNSTYTSSQGLVNPLFLRLYIGMLEFEISCFSVSPIPLPTFLYYSFSLSFRRFFVFLHFSGSSISFSFSLRLYDHDVVDSSLILSRAARLKLRDDPLFLLGPYINNFRDCLEALQFADLSFTEDTQTILNMLDGRKRDNALGVWQQQGWQCSGRNTSVLSCSFPYMDSPNVCICGEARRENPLATS